jgi:Icc-related predicted phosphoesterase
MKIFHFSDSHGIHSLLEIPKNIDLIIFSGDESNYYDSWKNEPECRDFINWFFNLYVKHKIMIAGNHSAFIAKNTKEFKKLCKDKNIIYLENEEVYIEGFKIWGSPFSPTFGNWHFMKSRDKMDKLWQNIPEDTDILVTHTPPRGCLDLSYDRNHNLEFCGCSALLKHIFRVKPILHLYGHVHTTDGIYNAGQMKLANLDTIFSNGSIVTDGKFGKISSSGNVFEINKIIDIN